MGFKNDNQRKAVMATLNNGASTRQNTPQSTLSQLKNNSSKFTKITNQIDKVTDNYVKNYKEDVFFDYNSIKDNGDKEFLFAIRPSGTNIMTTRQLNTTTKEGYESQSSFLIGDNKKFFHFNDGKLTKISKEKAEKLTDDFKSKIGWEADFRFSNDGVTKIFNKKNSTIQLIAEDVGKDAVDIIVRHKGTIKSKVRTTPKLERKLMGNKIRQLT